MLIIVKKCPSLLEPKQAWINMLTQSILLITDDNYVVHAAIHSVYLKLFLVSLLQMESDESSEDGEDIIFVQKKAPDAEEETSNPHVGTSLVQESPSLIFHAAGFREAASSSSSTTLASTSSNPSPGVASVAAAVASTASSLINRKNTLLNQVHNSI